MAHLTQPPPPIAQRLAELFLWPGEAVCNLLEVNDQDSRMLLRLFVNTSVYGKIGVVIVLSIF